MRVGYDCLACCIALHLNSPGVYACDGSERKNVFAPLGAGTGGNRRTFGAWTGSSVAPITWDYRWLGAVGHKAPWKGADNVFGGMRSQA
jgi:hypothetical protein